MKKVFVFLILIGFIQSVNAQKLSLELHPSSDTIGLGNSIWYLLELTNNTENTLKLFRSPMSQYKAGGYEYSISCNGNIILNRKTSSLDTNEQYGERRITELAPGAEEIILGLEKFKLNDVGKYTIHITYYQDPSNLNESYAENKKTINLAKKITPFKVELTESFEIK